MEAEHQHHFLEVPYDYPLCLNQQCPKASTCLRQLAEQEISDSVKSWVIISPKYQAALQGDCPDYRSNTKVRYAQGFIGVLDNLPHKQLKSVILCLINQFGRRTYYRIRKGERLLSPSEQQEIQKILKKCGVLQPLMFDAYVEGYEW